MGSLQILFTAATLAAAPGTGQGPGLGVTLSVNGGPDGVEAFLLERILHTWENAEVLDETHESAELLTVFRVAIDWLSAHQVSVVVEQDGQPFTDRTIEVQDSLQAKLTLWILLKSTLNRGLKQAHLRGADLSEPPRAGWDFAAGEGGEAPAPAGTTPTEVPPAAVPAPPSVSVPQPSPEPSADVETRAVVSSDEPVSYPIHTAWGALPSIWLETPKLFAAGLYATFSAYWNFLAMGLQLGYRYTDGVHGLKVHGLPLTALFGFEWGGRVRAAIGLLLTAELKLPAALGNSSAAFGAEGGAYAQARLPVSETAYLILRPALTCRMIRMQYEYTDPDGVDRTTREHPCTVVISAGLEWR